MVRVEQWGTFDVANYGDLLFPFVLQHGLESLSQFDLMLASPYGVPAQSYAPFKLRRIVRFEEQGFYAQAQAPHAFILGGGDIIRFDDPTLNGIYERESSQRVSRSFSVFLDDLGKLAQVRPVFWNAVGVPFDFLPAQYERVRCGTQYVRYLSVRDELSRQRLVAAGVEKDIRVVPDSAFLVSELFSPEMLATTIERLKAQGYFPVKGETLTVQIPYSFGPLYEEMATQLCCLLEEFPALQICLVPIGICHGDLPILRQLHRRIGSRAFLVDVETDPLEVAATIAHSNYFVGSSLHGNITAFVYRVPHLILSCFQDAPTKLAQYATWVERETCLIRSIGELLSHLRLLVQGALPVNAQRGEYIVARIREHFEYLRGTLLESQREDGQSERIGRLSAAHNRFVQLLAARPAPGGAEIQWQAVSESELRTLLVDSHSQRLACNQELLNLLDETEELRAQRDHYRDQLDSLKATRWWQVGNLYWQMHARLKKLLQL